MLSAPRIIAIDDNRDDLDGLTDGLSRSGTACARFLFREGVEGLIACPHVRVIFADLNLAGSSAPGDHTKDFSLIGGLIEGTIKPEGPYILVLWTKSADQAAALAVFLETRIDPARKPLSVIPLDKSVHLDASRKVKDPVALVDSIRLSIKGHPQLNALFDWEEHVLGAAAATVDAIVGVAREDSSDRTSEHLSRLLYRLAEGAVGKENIEADRFRAVNEALLPILVDRIGALRQDANQDIWKSAFDAASGNTEFSVKDAAKLNKFLHFSDRESTRGDERGAIIELPEIIKKRFVKIFGIDAEAQKKQFNCANYGADAAPRWVAIQIQAACDFAQNQPGPLPYVLALEMPAEPKVNSTPPKSVWLSPVFDRENRQLIIKANARFTFSLPREMVKSIVCQFRVREQLLSDLIYKVHSHGSRPGTIHFDAVRARS